MNSNSLYDVKASCYHFSFNNFWQSSTWTFNKSKLYKTADCCFRDMLHFYFLKNGQGLVFIDQTALPDDLYFLRYLAIYELKLFVF